MTPYVNSMRVRGSWAIVNERGGAPRKGDLDELMCGCERERERERERGLERPQSVRRRRDRAMRDPRAPDPRRRTAECHR